MTIGHNSAVRGTFMEGREMTLDEWLDVERRRLEEFARFWRDNRTSSPDEFPAEKGVGEWDEQFMAFD